MCVFAYMFTHSASQIVMCLDDLNMAASDSYGNLPCAELLRQLVDEGGWYDRKNLTWKVHLRPACQCVNLINSVRLLTVLHTYHRELKESILSQLLEIGDGHTEV